MISRKVSGRPPGQDPGSRRAPSPFSCRDLALIADLRSPAEKIERYIELAVIHCGSPAALARALEVTPATVSQWRARRKNPDAVHLIQIQEIASRKQ